MTDSCQAVLKDVRTAILDGDYTQLIALLPALRQIEAELQAGDLATLRALQIEAARTEACLGSALSGVRSARRRIAEVAQAAKGLTTYDRGGFKATLPSVTSTPRRV
ncbi:MAG: hypothetical protein ACK4VZ_08895 [Paracoccaceae bacterium]